jgi:hypothetical protein
VAEAQEPSFAVDVWAMLSLFTQFTVPFTAIVTGLGEKAVVVIPEAPTTMDTVVPVGVGVGVVEEDELSQPREAPRSRAVITR